MGRNAEQNAEQRTATLDRLLTAGLELFASQGFAGTTIADVAERADCSKGLLYHYFPSKRALAEAVVVRWRSTLTQLAATVAEETSPERRIVAFTRAVARHVETHPATYRLQLRAMTDPALQGVAADLVAGNEDAGETWASAFAALGSQRPALDGRLFQTSLLGILAHHVLSPQPTPVRELVERLLERTLGSAVDPTDPPWSPAGP